jgi:hypothetical protein
VKLRRLKLTVEDVVNMLTSARTHLNDEWNRNVPVIPGDPKYLTAPYLEIPPYPAPPNNAAWLSGS